VCQRVCHTIRGIMVTHAGDDMEGKMAIYVESAGKVYRVAFWHVRGGVWDNPRATSRTTCVIIELPSGIVAGSGHADCSSKDNFNKQTGRKLAFARALKQFDRSERRVFWEKYMGSRDGKSYRKG